MLSRRGVRIKVMQLLYSLNRDQKLTYPEAKKRYWGSVENAFGLYLFNLYIVMHITQEAVGDQKRRKSKHLPTESDKTFTSKLFDNLIIQNIAENKTLAKEFKKLDFEEKVNKDYLKKIYDEFSKGEAHKAYLDKACTEEDHKEILLELYRFCRKDEFFIEIMEDNFSNWFDDKSVVIGTMKKTLKRLPDTNDKFYLEYYPDDDATKDFGEKVLDVTHQNDESFLEIIKPSLKNWDHERLAIIDMILLKMALAEMKFCPTIPTKVTLNEYVEVSKLYSTPKSKDFINGILDKLLKDLGNSGEINKEGRGLVT